MAEVKFIKGSEEWQMFMDYWALCQKYWEPEETDEWWEEALGKIDELSKKYGSTVFIRGLCMALVNELEVKHVSEKKGAVGKLNVFAIIAIYPIGTKMRIKDDDPGIIHEVHGYEWIRDTFNIIFRDGTKLNMSRIDLIEEVI